jgi:hypothetical protein
MIDGPNEYCYVNQNPWTNFDPEGLSKSWKWGGWFDYTGVGTLIHADVDIGCLLSEGAEQFGEDLRSIPDSFAKANALSQNSYDSDNGGGYVNDQVSSNQNVQSSLAPLARLATSVPGTSLTGPVAASTPVEEVAEATILNAVAKDSSAATPGAVEANTTASESIVQTEEQPGFHQQDEQQQEQGDVSKRLQYMGRTPGKNSSTGKAVQAQMQAEGKLRVNASGQTEILNSEGKWVLSTSTDMSHLTDAVSAWNNYLFLTGPKSPEVRSFMKDPKNYELDSSSINRSKGASLDQTYRPPATAPTAPTPEPQGP